MHKLVFGGLALAVLIGMSSLARAERAPSPNSSPPENPAKPEKQKNSITVPVQIKHQILAGQGEDGVVAKITLTRSMLKDLLAQPSEKQQGMQTPGFRTIVAGVSLSLAAVCGLFVVRGKRKVKRLAAGCVFVAMSLGVWSIADANLAPPQPFHPSKGKVEIVIVDEAGDAVIDIAERGWGKGVGAVPR